jgi:hypothetical protein
MERYQLTGGSVMALIRLMKAVSGDPVYLNPEYIIYIEGVEQEANHGASTAIALYGLPSPVLVTEVASTVRELCDNAIGVTDVRVESAATSPSRRGRRSARQ